MSATPEFARQHHLQNNPLPAAHAYREILLQNPDDLTALLGLSLLARQTTRPQPALLLAQAALAAALTPADSARALTQIGDCHLALNQTASAQSAFQQAIFLQPTLAAAHYGLGNTHALQDRYQQAALSFTHALQHAPRSPEAHFALAFTLTRLAHLPHAIALLKQALQLRPTFAAAWLNLGVTLIGHGQPQCADACYQLALLVEPQNHNTRLSAHLNHGHLHRARKHFSAAQQSYESALELASVQDPVRLAEVHIAFAYLHLEQHQLPQAWHSVSEARRADPHRQNPEIPNAQGILLLAEPALDPGVPNNWFSPLKRAVPHLSNLSCASDLRESPGPGDPLHATLHTSPLLHQAIQSFQQAESLGHKTASSNRGNALLRLGLAEQALAAHQAAVAADPHHPGARYNLALTQLRLGQYAQGWANYESRWQFREVHPTPRPYPQPRWHGGPLHATQNAALFLYSEQGLGDTLQFLRYLPPVIQRLQEYARPGAGAPGFAPETWDDQKLNLVLEVQSPLLRLVEAHLLYITHPTIHTSVIPHGTPPPPFTHHIPLLSLPALFTTTLETIPNQVPYLYLAPAAARPHIPLHTLRVGLSWAGNPNYPADHERSTRLQTFLPLLQLPGIHWLSLQKGPAAAQIATLPPHLQPLDAASSDRDLADTAALIQTLDLVLTTDTAIAHLAGALGKPLWLLLPWQSDWRWMQLRTDTPWYPTATLFRQPHPGDWATLVQQIAVKLQQTAASAKASGQTPGDPAANIDHTHR